MTVNTIGTNTTPIPLDDSNLPTTEYPDNYHQQKQLDEINLDFLGQNNENPVKGFYNIS